MAKISLNKLNLNKVTNVKTITISGQEVEVVEYLPVKSKIDLIEIAIQESRTEEGIYYNPFLLQAIFNFYLVKAYTNISFSKPQEDNILETYDLLEKNGVITEVMYAIPKEELKDLMDSFTACVHNQEKENGSVVGLIKVAMDRVNALLVDTSNKLEGLNLDTENISNILSIAKDNGAI